MAHHPIEPSVIVYKADKSRFLLDNDEREIDDVILKQYRAVTHRGVSENERRAWRESLARMASVLRDDAIPADLGVGVEFHVPQTQLRIDVTLTGYGPDAGRRAVIVELKQWEKVEATRKDAIVVTYLGHKRRETVHPSYQAWSYAAHLEGFNTAVHAGGVSLHPCAYLHNYERDGVVDDPRYGGYLRKAPLFLKGEAEKHGLRAFIRGHLSTGDGARTLDDLAAAEVRPSKALADSLQRLLKGHPEFVLLDDQKTVYEAALAAGRAASADRRKVVLVEGGPGTGKSVVAVHLLSALTAKGLNCRYVTRNAAPREVFQAQLTGSYKKGHRYAGLFTGSGAFVESAPAAFDVLIVDEAHRLNEKSGLYGNLGENQIKELIAAAKCTIFFLDEDQRVTLRDIGSKEAVRALAAEWDAEVEEHALTSQFRCAGSAGYLAWLDDVLGVHPTANPMLSPDEFDVRVFDSPSALHAAVEARNTRNKARVVAGYCWPWRSKKDPDAYDIVIGPDYRRRWNLADYGNLWAITPAGIHEVGCIHTCQGLDLDVVGVIVGPDFVVRGGEVRTMPGARAPQDRSLHGLKRLAEADPAHARAEADAIVKNTYRTLMTRGMRGCYLYCTDPETAAYFRSRLAAPTAARAAALRANA